MKNRDFQKRLSFFQKLRFFFKRPPVVVVVGKGRKTAAKAAVSVLAPHFNLGREIMVFESGLENGREERRLKFLMKRSKLPLLIITHFGEYHPEKGVFASEKSEVLKASWLAKSLSPQGFLLLNFDDETVRDIKEESKAHPLYFGFGARANIRATDLVLTDVPRFGTNFKVNYEGSIVPVWLENLFGKENIYASLAAVGAGKVLGLNLVETSAALKTYQGIRGRMKLLEGVKNSFVLDDSESATPLSMLESLDVLKRIKAPNRKIAVLGDISRIGKYTIEAHEYLGEKVKICADIFFAVGEKARFFVEGARKKGMDNEKIFHFTDLKKAGLALQEEIKPGDVVLIDGSKEMNMEELVEEVRKMG